MTPEVVSQAEAVVDNFLAAVKELQQGLSAAVILLEGFKVTIDAAKAAQITAGKGRESYGRDAN